jgi:nitrilase
MKTAIIQFNANDDKKRNIERALRWIRQAIGEKAEFILLPEAFNFRGTTDHRRGFKDIAEGFPGPSTIPLMEAAQKNKVTILAGSICEKVPGQRKVFNASVLINSAGHIVAKYRKSHLFRAVIGKTVMDEARYFERGSQAVLTRVGKWSVGMTICYDLRYPEFYRRYGRAGADILCVPSAFTKKTGQAHWEVLLRARAIENLCYVLAPNQIGKDGKGVPSYGHSMIVSPWGEILARASGNREEIIYANLDQGEISKAKKILPVQGRK